MKLDLKSVKPVKIDKILIGEAFTIQGEHEGGVLLAHTTVTIYPSCNPVFQAAYADLLNKQVPKRPVLAAVIGVGKQVWPNTLTTQNVDVTGSTAGIACGIGQYAAAKAVADFVAGGVITQEVGDQIFGIAVQQFHHWGIKSEFAEMVLDDQYNCACFALAKALQGGGSYEDTKANANHVHELVSKAAFGAIDPARIPEILDGKPKKLEAAAAS